MVTNFVPMKLEVMRANLDLPKSGLVKLTWGNVSMIDRERELIVIKPSGVPYADMSTDDMVVTDLEGKVLEGELSPSSDLATHLVLYKAFKEIGAVVHTHSKWAVAWAQGGKDIPAYGTTHADTFYGSIPCTRQLTEKEVLQGYEVETGNVIVETFRERNLDPLAVPGVIVRGHGPFTWGKTAKAAVQNSVVLDEVADMALHTLLVTKDQQPIPQYLLDKHYFRKHGPDAYYGQKNRLVKS
ncbi:L-ribulose-5-phosphate 4-epimerase [Paenibacillus larvae subsp. larvae]|uniref:L-ribulose-5-phosphate 4-epimerase n=2 Tax=Paenibacillus larvae TaxID=1464 RepID=A0A2L1UDD6_9BACL|nr:L-ribulose-5-phosphate 4-epimerase [Paenibacillus larvae]AVF26143.1 L-ribulose-5-phosphate 4-epimerase [Paenibacillus larvae subsp. larvae]AVF30921.1 L-ribulose-5-phosphate 4-epimerase [Paenibacillus larvae subsp. larvae]MCY7518333.1 L-ribulose-5-phosphate 4-epimerase [Paenibacillus larvae]MCY9500946.1 L-ribulose-5-phosphate 4-epimerase [Paenibacillus larvae]MCY9678114.1 L-ribulose-5-phosphate 4-epimerase [Paenibacillus larvae]